MPENKSLRTRMVSLEDLLLGAMFSWVVKRILDFFWAKGKTGISGESHVKDHFSRGLHMLYGETYVDFAVAILPKNPKFISRSLQGTLKGCLQIHKRYHTYVGFELCEACYKLIRFKQNFMRYVPDPDLYPPFSALDSWRKKCTS